MTTDSVLVFGLLQGMLNKLKRKLIASACLFLSAKLNDVKGPELMKLIQVCEHSTHYVSKPNVPLTFPFLTCFDNLSVQSRNDNRSISANKCHLVVGY